MVDRSADILTSKRLGAAAMELCEMVVRDRHGELLRPKPKLTERIRERRARLMTPPDKAQFHRRLERLANRRERS
jgi:hypothetical protein